MDAVAGGGAIMFLSPYFSVYTNDEPLKINFRGIDSLPLPPKKNPKTKNQKKTKNKSHFGAVSPQRLIFQFLAQSGI